MWNVERNEGYNGNGGGSDSNSSVEHFVQACGGRWYGAKSSCGLSSLLRYTFHASPFFHLSKVVFLIMLWYQLLWPICLIVFMWSAREKRPEFTWNLLLLALLSGILGYVNFQIHTKFFNLYMCSKPKLNFLSFCFCFSFLMSQPFFLQNKWSNI